MNNQIVYSVSGDGDYWTTDFQEVIENIYDSIFPDMNLGEEDIPIETLVGMSYFQGIAIDPGQLIDSSDIVDTLVDRAWDSGGEYVDCYPDIPKEGIIELDEFLKQWYEKYAKPNWFEVRDVIEMKFTKEDLS